MNILTAQGVSYQSEQMSDAVHLIRQGGLPLFGILEIWVVVEAGPVFIVGWILGPIQARGVHQFLIAGGVDVRL